jgi:alkanesulfonate monooxygenase SsuD/methylene tetrahydromethanopterin reductase-like flavin-dependent oxidoreductase (luciferase family)
VTVAPFVTVADIEVPAVTAEQMREVDRIAAGRLTSGPPKP